MMLMLFVYIYPDNKHIYLSMSFGESDRSAIVFGSTLESGTVYSILM